MNYCAIKRSDVANGPGMRVTLFVSGCTNRCPGCFQPETWDFAYGEPFTVPEPDELVFIGTYDGGEVFRSGCCYRKENGRVFYFQPGHETYRSYFHPSVRRILQNAVHYLAQPELRQERLDCIPV